MLRSVFWKTLRDNRWGALAWGLGLALIIFVSAASYLQVAGAPGAGRAAQVAEFAKLLQTYGAFFGEIVPLDTLGGFLTVRVMGTLPGFLILWAAVVGVGLIRGEEEIGALDVLLTTPHSRVQVFAHKVAALALCILGAVGLLGVGLVGGGLAIGEPLPLDAVGLTLLNIGVTTALWAAVGLLVGQLVQTRRPASVAIGGVLFFFFLFDNLAVSTPALKPIAGLNPNHYYNLSKPLVPGRGMDWAAWLVLVGLTLGVLALGAWLFTRRDLGAAFRLGPASTRAGRGGSLAGLGSVFARAGRDSALPTLAWGGGLGAFAAIFVASTNDALGPLRAALKNIPFASRIIGNLTTNESFLAVSIFLYLPLLLAMFALTQLWGWAGDEEEGRLELLTAQPLPRVQVLLARYLAAAGSLAGILLLLGGLIALTASITNTLLDMGRVWAALLAVVPVVGVVLLVGYALATWLPRPSTAVAILGVGIVVMFFYDVLAGLFGLPPAARSLSIFYLYGRPLTDGVNWGNAALMTAVAGAAGVLALVGFGRRDIAK